MWWLLPVPLDGKDDIGFATKITSDDVQKFSSVTRDIRDFVRLNPFAIVDSVNGRVLRCRYWSWRF